MTNTSLDISGKIDASAAHALGDVKAAADSLSLPFFVIGATARDIFLKHLYGLGDCRMTKDLDFGVSLSKWEDFSALKTALIEDHGFESANQIQRLQKGKILIDVVPFGPISGIEHKLRWPPDESRQMTTTGFDEAFRFSLQVRVSSSPEVLVKVCSLAGLVILKLISWHERYPERRPDAEDILEIMDKYENAVGVDSLYSEAHELIMEEGFDNRMAAIRLLGRDIASIASPETAGMISSILDEETKEDSRLRLAIDMARGVGSAAREFQSIVSKLSKLKQGFSGSSPRA
ncbi:MAG: nucleotidyl transferase AbiEii/AbiGii toxin family protein [Candidatus Aminicenantes bacterium]|nr:nucleotidyl transferase AbiEii/AbiGii toxin family protein [Candidatus Aminicenantes bacterium]